MSTKITIFIPAYNRPKTIVRAIDSCLAQDYDNLEVLVGDNSTNDEVNKVIQPYLSDSRFKYYKNPENLGMLRNWRKGLFEYVTGDYFSIMGDDDYFINNHYVSQVVDIIENNEPISMVFSNCYKEYVQKNNKRVGTNFNYNSMNNGKEFFLATKNIDVGSFLSTLLFNKELALKFKAFEGENMLAWDLKLYLLLTLNGDVGFIKDYSGVHTFHNENLSLTSMMNDINILKSSIDATSDSFDYAVSNGLLLDNEKIKWENEVLFISFFKNLIHVKYYNFDLVEEFIDYLMLRNSKVCSMVLKSLKYKLVLFLEKLKLFRLVYSLIFKLKFN